MKYTVLWSLLVISTISGPMVQAQAVPKLTDVLGLLYSCSPHPDSIARARFDVDDNDMTVSIELHQTNNQSRLQFSLYIDVVISQRQMTVTEVMLLGDGFYNFALELVPIMRVYPNDQGQWFTPKGKYNPNMKNQFADWVRPYVRGAWHWAKVNARQYVTQYISVQEVIADMYPGVEDRLKQAGVFE